MKKRELLIIFVLAILVTVGSWFYIGRVGTNCVGLDLLYRGFPRTFYIEYRHNPARASGFPCGLWNQPPISTGFLIDLFFWFLLAFGSWQMAKFIKIRMKK
jgi:hypothetical protein